jgi:hypothetical protein
VCEYIAAEQITSTIPYRVVVVVATSYHTPMQSSVQHNPVQNSTDNSNYSRFSSRTHGQNKQHKKSHRRDNQAANQAIIIPTIVIARRLLLLLRTAGCRLIVTVTVTAAAHGESLCFFTCC